MTDLTNTIEYIFRLKQDVSAAAEQASQSSIRADQDVSKLQQTMESVNGTAPELQSTLETVREQVRTAGQDVSAELDGVTARADRTSDESRGIIDRLRSYVRDNASEIRSDYDSMMAKSDEARRRIGSDLESMDRQAKQIDIMTQLTTIMGMREGVSAVTGGLIGLGVVAGEDAEQLNRINAAFSLFAGAITMIKTLQAVTTTLNAVEGTGAVITAFRAAVSNPMGIALVGAGLGAAAGVAGALMLSSSTTNNTTTNITVQDTTPAEARVEVYQLYAGGALG